MLSPKVAVSFYVSIALSSARAVSALVSSDGSTSSEIWAALVQGEDELTLLQTSSNIEHNRTPGVQAAALAGDSLPLSLKATVEGTTVLAAKARIMGQAMAKATVGTLNEIQRGNLTGVWSVATEAASAASEQSSLVDSAISPSGSRSIGILLAFVFVGMGWALELLLTKRGHDRPTGEERDEPRPEETGRSDANENQETHHYLAALSFARLIVACHVVLYNFYPYPGGVQEQTSSMGSPLAVFARWGILSAPWFFMVAGFMNSYSKYVNPSSGCDDFFQHMLHRVAVWYPLFVISITWCALRYFTTSAEDWSHFMSELLLVHGLMWPHGEKQESYFPFWSNDWWLSYMTVYLLTWWPMHQVLSDSSISNLRILFYMAWAITVPSAIFEWFFMGEEGLFSMIQFWPSFVIGQAVATWFVKTCMQQKAFSDAPNDAMTQAVWVLRPVHEIPTAVRFGATISFLTFGIMCFLFSPHDTIPVLNKNVKPIFTKGGLLPLQALMVLGLACEVDPLARVMARRPFRWASKLTMGMFLLQVPVHNTVRDLFGWGGLNWTFCVLLVLISWLCYYVYERPWRRYLRARAAALAVKTVTTPPAAK